MHLIVHHDPICLGQKLNAEAVRKLLTEAKIHSPDWETIGTKIGLKLKISAADFFDAWSAHDSKASWVKLANALEKIPEYKHASSKVQEKQGTYVCELLQRHIVIILQLASCMQEYIYYCFSTVRTLSKDSLLELFSEADVQVPENWRQIGLQLGLDLKGQLSATDFFNGWNENASTNNKPSWEKLAQALFKMDGLYRTAASKASMKARKNYVENNHLYLL